MRGLKLIHVSKSSWAPGISFNTECDSDLRIPKPTYHMATSCNKDEIAIGIELIVNDNQNGGK